MTLASGTLVLGRRPDSTGNRDKTVTKLSRTTQIYERGRLPGRESAVALHAPLVPAATAQTAAARRTCWSGLRGAVAIALLLSLEDGTPDVATIKPIAYGVVLLSIVVQGATVAPVAGRLLSHARQGPAESVSAHG